MTGKRDYYEVLGVGQNASADEIRNAFRSLAKKYHPDVATEDGAEEIFKEKKDVRYLLSKRCKKLF